MGVQSQGVTVTVMGVVLQFILKILCLTNILCKETFPKSFIELLCVEIEPIHAASFFVMAWYRPPNATADTFDHFEKYLYFLDREDKEIILLGDTNLDISTKYSKVGNVTIDDLPAHSLHLLEISNLFGLHQLIERPSRETLTTRTLIDHIATTTKFDMITFWVKRSLVIISWSIVFGSSRMYARNSLNIFLLGK